MKKLTLILWLYFAAYSFVEAQKSNLYVPFNPSDSIRVSGKIVGYHPTQADHFITFSTYDLTGRQKNQAIQIDDSGSFSVKLFQPFEGDVQMAYKENYLNIYAKPNLLTELIINDSKLEQSAIDAIFFTGNHQISDANNLMYKFQVLRDANPSGTTPDMGDKKQGDSLYAVSVRKKLNEDIEFLKEFIEKNGVKNKTFIDWQTQQLMYNAGKDILFYPFAGKLNTTINQKQLLALISGIPVNNSEAFTNSAYYSFLDMLCGSQQIMVNINPAYQEQINATKSKTIVCLDELDRFTTGLTRQLFYYDFYLKSLKKKQEENYELKKRLDQVIQHPFLKALHVADQVPLPNNFASYSVLARLKSLGVKSDLKERLLSTFAKYEGKNLYIDFWGDWCGPCMSELPNYPKLIKAVVNKPIHFIFFSTFTTQDNMLAIKKKYGIEGDFINLNKDEVAIINNVLDFHSYPSHFLVNSKMEIIGRGGSLQRTEDINPAIELLKDKFKW